MKTNVKNILFALFLTFLGGCSQFNNSKSDAELVNIIKTEDLDQQSYKNGNIYLIPEKKGDNVSYYIQTKDSGLGFIVNKESYVQAFNCEKEFADKRINTLFKFEDNIYFWEIDNGKEIITIKLNNEDNSDFEIIKSKRE
ncbi:MAG TPA: hypothetical protein PK624_03560 [Spirochaetota bacterium]|nr:hypothetical protein [Spirochaetota bacterium]HPK55967.1 hypothetical protein [Spirochaetota bacterium]